MLENFLKSTLLIKSKNLIFRGKIIMFVYSNTDVQSQIVIIYSEFYVSYIFGAIFFFLTL